jgi:hypothetical protein
MSASRCWKAALAGIAVAVTAALAAAQPVSEPPYAGLQTREIKALSEQQMSDLAAGRGIGLALAAELNGYPGPKHVLELADRLAITGQQRADIQRLFDSMKSDAIPLGQKLIAAERDLDRAFAERTITPDKLKTATAAIAEITGALRNAHLKYHLATAALLGPDQIRRYAELRGYDEAAATADPHPGAACAMPGHAAMDCGMHQHGTGATSPDHEDAGRVPRRPE